MIMVNHKHDFSNNDNSTLKAIAFFIIYNTFEAILPAVVT